MSNRKSFGSLNDLSDFRRGWVSGLIEGEGHITKDGRFQVGMTDQDTISRLITTTGIGRFNGPYEQRGKGTKPWWRWSVNAHDQCLQLAQSCFSLMGTRRAARLTDVFGVETSSLSYTPTSWMDSDLDLGWLIGIIEGEGCFTCSQKCWSGGEYREWIISVSMTDKDVIDRLPLVAGGRVSPTPRPPAAINHKPLWSWRLSRRKEVKNLLEAMIPHLSQRRTDKAIELLTSYTEYAERPVKQHGTRWCYDQGCRNQECRDAHATRLRNWRRQNPEKYKAQRERLKLAQARRKAVADGNKN